MFSCNIYKKTIVLGCMLCLFCLSGCLTTSLLRSDKSPTQPGTTQQPPQHTPTTLPLKAPHAPVASTPQGPTVKNIPPAGSAPVPYTPAKGTEPPITTDPVSPAMQKVTPKDLSVKTPTHPNMTTSIPHTNMPATGKAVAANPYPPFDVKKTDGQTLTTY